MWCHHPSSNSLTTKSSKVYVALSPRTKPRNDVQLCRIAEKCLGWDGQWGSTKRTCPIKIVAVGLAVIGAWRFMSICSPRNLSLVNAMGVGDKDMSGMDLECHARWGEGIRLYTVQMSPVRIVHCGYREIYVKYHKYVHLQWFILALFLVITHTH